MTHYGDHAGRLLLSRGAILNIVNSNRNYGKTWAFKRRAVRRYLKHGKKTLWLRVFQEEARSAAASFFGSADLRRFCGIEPWDKDRKAGDFRREGNRILIRRRGRWDWAIMICAVSEAGTMRGVDDVALDTIVLDEYAKTPSQLRRYAGNVVSDFFDIFFSVKREHEVRAVLLGNKENSANPFLAYFGIEPPKPSWEGVRMYRGGTIALQQINNRQASSDYATRVAAMMAGTAYGEYLAGAVKGAVKVRKRKAPPGASIYAQVDFEGKAFRVLFAGDAFYFADGIDRGRAVFATGSAKRYPKQLRLSNRSKPLFRALAGAIEGGRVFYSGEALSDAVEPFLSFLGAK